MPDVTIEGLSDNCQVTVIITELVDVIDDPNPPAEKPEDQDKENVWLVSKKAAD